MHLMTARSINARTALIGVALALLLAISPDRGAFPSTADIIAVEHARAVGADLDEWRLLSRFISEQPHNARIWERMAVLDYRNGLCQQAVFEFGQATAYGKLTEGNLAFYGVCLMELGKFQETVGLLAPYVAEKQKADGLNRLLARAYLRQSKIGSAILVLEQWIVLEPHNAAAHYYLGLFQALDHPSESLQILQNAARENTEYDEAYREIQTAINTGQLSDNKAYQAVEIGRAYGSMNEWELAEYAFWTATRADPAFAEAHAWLGEARQHLGLDGSNELQTALKLKPDSILVQALNALYLQRLGASDQALVFLNQIALSEPTNPEWQMALGQVNAQLGQLEKARAYYQLATELQPQSVVTWQALAEFCFSYQFEVTLTGVPAANKSVLLSPDSPRSLDLAGQAAMTNENLGSAEAYLRRAIEIDMHYSAAHLHLGLLLLQRGNNTEAHQELEKAAILGSIEAAHLLTQINTQ